ASPAGGQGAGGSGSGASGGGASGGSSGGTSGGSSGGGSSAGGSSDGGSSSGSSGGSPGGNAGGPPGATSDVPGSSSPPSEPTFGVGARTSGPAGGDGDSGEGGSSSSFNKHAPTGPRSKREPPAPRVASRTLPNRDLLIAVECTAEGVIVPGTPMISPSALVRGNDPDNPLLKAVQKIIDRRQTTLRPGEAPYRAHIRFLVRPDGLRTYYLAFPALEGLQVPMTRENLKADNADNE
ncbi:MAG: hypothetical protein K2R98_20105, partial [Gemmataceae bacterium]|nr:hypothetical protein [Gemmataceae bacterium]